MTVITSPALRARWQALAPREQTLVLAAGGLVAFALLWWLAVAPALSTFRAAPARHAELDSQLQGMQGLRAEAQQLQAAQRNTRGDSVGALRTALTQRLGNTAQLNVVGDRATVTLKGAPADALAQWLAQARSNTRAAPSSRHRKPVPRAPRSAWGWALVGAVAGVVPAVVAFAPAHWLAQSVASATGGQVQLLQARGTVWTGSAQLVLTGGSASQDSAALPSRLDWRIRPGWGGLHAQLNASCCTPTPLRLQASAGWSGTRLTIIDGESLWPASVLTGLGTPWNTLQPQGQLALQTRGFTMRWSAGRMSLAGQVQLDARAMSSRLSTLRPMGSYRLAVQGGEAPTLTLSTLDGHLQLNGTGQWVGNRLRFAGEASATPEREAALSNLLNIIGRRNGARSIITVG